MNLCYILMGKNVTEVAMKLTKEMQNVVEWLNNSCFTLNVDKTVSMFFTNRSKLGVCPEILVNGQKIYLGVLP